MLRKVGRRGLADAAADRIRDAIFAGTFPPGAALREVELAADLDVSRGSVREGLTILEREGLIHSGWHRGTKVIDVTVQDANEIYAVRAALEGLAARSAIGRVDLDELDALVDGMVAHLVETERTSDGQHDDLLALDMRFHDLIYQATGNTRLVNAWEALRSQMYLFQMTRIRLSHQHYRNIVVDEHREIVRLLRAGDGYALAQYAEEHVQSGRRVLVAALTP
ncbi:GntR family transcriptional regulator [Kibdelosporangium lantanae]